MCSNRCEPIVLRLVDVRKMLVVTGSVPLGDLWPTGCWDRTVLLGLYCFNVFVVWFECVKSLLVNVCNGTARSADQGTLESPLDNTLIVVGLLFSCSERISRLSIIRDSLYVRVVEKIPPPPLTGECFTSSGVY